MFCPNCGNQTNSNANFCSSCGTNVTLSPNYQALAKDFGYTPYAGFWKRFVAYMLDTMLISIVSGIVIFSFVFLSVTDNPSSNESILLQLAIQSFSIAINWLYFALMESSAKQATLGKMLLGIKVTDINGQRISFGRATGRHFGKILSAITLSIGYIMAAFTAKKQALHDMVAGSLVVNN